MRYRPGAERLTGGDGDCHNMLLLEGEVIPCLGRFSDVLLIRIYSRPERPLRSAPGDIRDHCPEVCGVGARKMDRRGSGNERRQSLVGVADAIWNSHSYRQGQIRIMT